LETNDPNLGYDATMHKITAMVKAGIVDPTKVVRTALEDAASVAGLMTTSEAMVVILPEDKKSPMPQSPGGMDMY